MQIKRTEKAITILSTPEKLTDRHRIFEASFNRPWEFLFQLMRIENEYRWVKISGACEEMNGVKYKNLDEAVLKGSSGCADDVSLSSDIEIHIFISEKQAREFIVDSINRMNGLYDE